MTTTAEPKAPYEPLRVDLASLVHLDVQTRVFPFHADTHALYVVFTNGSILPAGTTMSFETAAAHVSAHWQLQGARQVVVASDVNGVRSRWSFRLDDVAYLELFRAVYAAALAPAAP
ncbi:MULTISPECIES: hypothetical protein [unclassified Streptomyces]|uniref:hypothetical protein n=1 Tax=unclassified Streptomyces TaxID=2593676 RepID=UPI0035E29B63